MTNLNDALRALRAHLVYLKNELDWSNDSLPVLDRAIAALEHGPDAPPREKAEPPPSDAPKVRASASPNPQSDTAHHAGHQGGGTGVGPESLPPVDQTAEYVAAAREWLDSRSRDDWSTVITASDCDVESLAALLAAPRRQWQPDRERLRAAVWSALRGDDITADRVMSAISHLARERGL